MAEQKLPLWSYWRSYYDINRETWPSMSRRAAAWDAVKVTWRIRNVRTEG